MSALMTLDTDLACCDARRGEGRSVSGGSWTRDRAVELAGKFGNAAPPPVSRRRERREGRGRERTPESVEKVHSDIVSGARYAEGVCPRRGAAPEAPRGLGESEFSDVNFPGRRSAGERARARRVTYLDLGRLEGGDRAGEGGGNAGHFVV